MENVRDELRTGWRQARWGFFFSVALLPAVTVAVLIAFAAEGTAALTPSPLAALLCIPATVAALFWAGYKDGLQSALGRFVWTLLILLFVWVLLRELIRRHVPTATKELKAGDQAFNLHVWADPADSADSGRGTNSLGLPRGKWDLSPIA